MSSSYCVAIFNIFFKYLLCFICWTFSICTGLTFTEQPSSFVILQLQSSATNYQSSIFAVSDTMKSVHVSAFSKIHVYKLHLLSYTKNINATVSFV